jgi:hypothetical protein
MTEKELKENADSYWPAKFDSNLLCGAMEVGSDLYLTGNFGGFGGHLSPLAHRTFEDAKAYILELRPSYGGEMIFKLELPKSMKFIANDGREIEP